MFARSLVAAVMVALPILGLAWKAGDLSAPAFDRASQLQAAQQALLASGLSPSDNSHVTVSGMQAAVVFQRPECAGSIIVLPLPPTAQSFRHVLGLMDAPVSAEGFVFRGSVVPDYPRWTRLIGKLGPAMRIADPSRGGGPEPVYAFREIGPCELSTKIDWSKLQRGVQSDATS